MTRRRASPPSASVNPVVGLQAVHDRADIGVGGEQRGEEERVLGPVMGVNEAAIA